MSDGDLLERLREWHDEVKLAHMGHAIPDDSAEARVCDALVALAALAKQREHFGCPACDGSGAWQAPDGSAVQCQACDEYEQARAALERLLEGNDVE